MNRKILNISRIVVVFALVAIIASCDDYLNIIPDNTPTIDHAFKNRHEAEKYLYGCFSFLPNHADPTSNPALFGGDEVWYIDPANIVSPLLWNIAKGNQGTNSPLADYWASIQDGSNLQGGKALFTALSDCNIFLENIDKPFDLDKSERDWWVSEVLFLKAYYHYYLFRMYGPIPLIRENLPISSTTEEVRRFREPVDDVVEYIVELLDQSLENLPEEILDVTSDMGRPTKATALALKAQVLTLAASPLFNGNTDYASVVDKKGRQLFPQEYRPEKWQRAAAALKEAIDAAHEAGHELFDFSETTFARDLNAPTILAMQVRGAVTERWNKEIIWGESNFNPDALQRVCFPAWNPNHNSGGIGKSYAPTLQVVEQFYTSNGVPIEEDRDWEGVDPMGIRTGDASHKFYIKEGYQTVNLHFNREARFYGSVTFDGGTFYGNGRISTDDNMWHTPMRGADPGGGVAPTERYSSTGYLCKKLVHYLSSVPEANSSITTYRYAFPIIRLADLYLMYAEALNEVKSSPDEEVYEYVDLVRARTGLKGVVESWQDHSNVPDKPASKEGMREIIRRERLNELAFEGSRFWDLRRWKLSEEYMNRPIRGLNIRGENPADFYQVREIYRPTFGKKDYLWPIRLRVLLKNTNLVQNLGW
ncbi:RagB/SusD family nutrient uptake outer membrane protein [Petrimonas mucosa]|uniref:RagB/SusD family nutrient uptake outer membrane protein n=3 Tax=Petrimonas mucosa TaxID=1642646 RepID=UPI0017772E2A|nr:RagB/SusD family nutrient uptake outer membrane protein [Petrimonas mucosa]MDD3560975.1 RagB/SusD family nutrient uptake outer membrane protein [Petrimonas mucosa]HHT29023.1 RagB/SusD family nutrient uptake outer membrane protein [Petrimonas mucosa]